MTGGGNPPRDPVNVWILLPVAAAVLAAALLAVVAAVEVELVPETPRALLNASAAACVVPPAAANFESQ
jgi:hypothetical protein